MFMTNYIQVGDLRVASALYDFINKEALPQSGVDQEKFWAGFDQLVHDLAPENKALLERRDELQEAINNKIRIKKIFKVWRISKLLI